ncbi:MAG TPA: M28 family peptidase, partial [Chitinophagaceae bacterium]|nr:M28 family peptidase [Chitinophagaceae bacterium]
MRKFVLPLALLLLTVGAAAQSNSVASKFASNITAKDLKAKLTVIASAEMEGRETATPGQKRAAAYIENFFKSIGLQPGTPGGYQLKYPVYQDSLSNVSLSINGNNLVLDKDFNISPSSFISGDWKTEEITFARYGTTDSANNNLNGLDVKDKWVMVLDGTAADGERPNFRAARAKLMNLTAKAVKGIFIVSKDFPKAKPSPLKGSMYVTKRNGAAIPIITISVSQAAAILSKPGSSFDDLKTAVRGIYEAKMALNIATVTNNLESSDVIGVLPGTDKKDEYVLVTGHYDHLGKRDSVIYYGADDDGSGTTSVLEIAQTFAKAKAKGHGPRRTMIFMTVSGEEEGLWGSDYYTSHPVFPLEKTSVDLNTDMVGRIDPGYKGD